MSDIALGSFFHVLECRDPWLGSGPSTVHRPIWKIYEDELEALNGSFLSSFISPTSINCNGDLKKGYGDKYSVLLGSILT